MLYATCDVAPHAICLSRLRSWIETRSSTGEPLPPRLLLPATREQSTAPMREWQLRMEQSSLHESGRLERAAIGDVRPPLHNDTSRAPTAPLGASHTRWSASPAPHLRRDSPTSPPGLAASGAPRWSASPASTLPRAVSAPPGVSAPWALAHPAMGRTTPEARLLGANAPRPLVESRPIRCWKWRTMNDRPP